MEETIRIRSVDKSDWGRMLNGFQPDQVQQVLAIYSVDGQVVETICELVNGKFYINGQPDVDYPSLQAAAGAVIRGERDS